eukprot:jgi/Ulvmu1/10271/UM060_0073.1
MQQAEEERRERIARNEAMLRQVTGAAEDLACCVDAAPPVNDHAARRHSFKQRLASEALQHGSRKSSRAASNAAAKRISKSLHHSDEEENSAGSASASGSIGSDSGSEDDEPSEHESPSSDDPQAEVGKRHDTQPALRQGEHETNVDVAQEDLDMKLAIAISMEGENSDTAAALTDAGARGATTEASEEASHSRAVRPTPNSKAVKKTGGRKRRKRLNLSDAEVDAVFAFVARGKVTVGREEIVQVVNQLGLDVDDSMLDAACEVLEGSGCAGPCTRLDQHGLRLFMEHLES